ncbi:MAG TPA: hypothetical protein VJR30_02950 [Bradyrhizobium sp.]|nr:hypothetical protein [Bradyrhizobium sp.]
MHVSQVDGVPPHQKSDPEAKQPEGHEIDREYCKGMHSCLHGGLLPASGRIARWRSPAIQKAAVADDSERPIGTKTPNFLVDGPFLGVSQVRKLV